MIYYLLTPHDLYFIIIYKKNTTYTPFTPSKYE